MNLRIMNLRIMNPTIMNPLKFWYLKTFYFNTDKKIDFYETLLSYSEDGQNLGNYLSKLNTRNKARKKRESAMTAMWESKRGNGEKLSHALSGWISHIEWLLLDAVGESSGGQTLALRQCLFILKAQQKIKKVLFKAAWTMSFWIVMTIAFVWFFSTTVFPPLIETLPKRLYSDSDFILRLSAFIRENTPLIVITLVVVPIIIVAMMLFMRPNLFRKKVLDAIPPFSIFKLYESANFILTVSSMVTVGKPLIEALEFASKKAGRWKRYYLSRMIERQNAGRYKTGKVLDVEGFIQERIMDRIDDYSEANHGFEKNLEKIGHRAVNDSIKKIEMISQGTTVIVRGFYFATMMYFFYKLADFLMLAQNNSYM